MVTLYTTGCPRCHILESKLNEKKIPFQTVNGIEAADAIEELGYLTAPLLVNDDEVMDFNKAMQWIGGQP